jgi:serine/threonine protein kinase
MAFTAEQLRNAVLAVLRGKVPKRPGILFDHLNEVKIGARQFLVSQGLIPFDPLGDQYAENAFEKTDQRILDRIFAELEVQGFIHDIDEYGHFEQTLIPAPFDKEWQFDGDLGGGRQSSTRRVLRLSDDRQGVLKLPTNLNETAKKRFRREVEIITATRHPSVVELLAVNTDETAGALGYVTPLGIPLGHYWKQFGEKLLPRDRYDRAYLILSQLCEGLSLLHQKQTVHRDIKPENVIMLGGRAILIDFGVAARPDDERLSPIEGRAVVNRFATPPAAHYGLEDITPAWDSPGLAWLYGFMVGKADRPKQFHWRFHPIVEEDRSERARALLAVSSHETTMPKDAASFFELMNRLRLDGSPPDPLPQDGTTLDAAEIAHSETLARDLIDAANTRETVEVAIQLFASPLTELRSALRQKCVGSPSAPIVQYGVNPEENETLFLISAPNAPMTGILKQAYHAIGSGYSDVTQSDVCIFHCYCGSRRRFKVSASVIYDRCYQGDDALCFSLYLASRDDFGERRIWRDAAYSLHPDGTFRNKDSGSQESIGQIVDRAQEWTRERLHWANL